MRHASHTHMRHTSHARMCHASHHTHTSRVTRTHASRVTLSHSSHTSPRLFGASKPTVGSCSIALDSHVFALFNERDKGVGADPLVVGAGGEEDAELAARWGGGGGWGMEGWGMCSMWHIRVCCM